MMIARIPTSRVWHIQRPVQADRRRIETWCGRSLVASDVFGGYTTDQTFRLCGHCKCKSVRQEGER